MAATRAYSLGANFPTITGATGSSAGVPTTTGAWQTSPGGNSDAFAAAFDSAGANLVFSTLVGGSGDDFGRGIALDAAGHGLGLTQDVFVARFNAAGSSALYATYLGGEGNDVGQGVAIDADGYAYVTGTTVPALLGANFPTTSGAYCTSFPGSGSAAFLTKLNTTGTALSYSTLFGSSVGRAPVGAATPPQYSQRG